LQIFPPGSELSCSFSIKSLSENWLAIWDGFLCSVGTTAPLTFPIGWSRLVEIENQIDVLFRHQSDIPQISSPDKQKIKILNYISENVFMTNTFENGKLYCLNNFANSPTAIENLVSLTKQPIIPNFEM
jgi:hypothetical protein